MHALTPYIQLLQDYISVSLQHDAPCTTTPVLPCTRHLLVADSLAVQALFLINEEGATTLQASGGAHCKL